MEPLTLFHFQTGSQAEHKSLAWVEFLKKENFDFSQIQKIDFTEQHPKIYDQHGHKFCIDFVNDRRNYHKKKMSMKKELLGRAMGSGRYGLKVLDLSAGLAVDALFLAQLGFEVTAIERNPLIYLALQEAALYLPKDLKVEFVFGSAQEFLKTNSKIFDVVYFDPMFPEKTKSALPRQEMVFFRGLVGADLDADAVVKMAVCQQGVQRVVIKRPLKAPALYKNSESQIEGKLVRFDIYGVER